MRKPSRSHRLDPGRFEYDNAYAYEYGPVRSMMLPLVYIQDRPVLRNRISF
jgi:hypothetical protein